MVLRTPLKAIKNNFSEPELIALFDSIEGNEALFLASPDLHLQYTKWREGADLDVSKKERLLHSLLKYALRVHTRCTPFGLFAKCSLIQWGDSTNIELDDKRLYRSTRLDMHFTCQLAQELAKLDFVKPYLMFYPNSSLYKVRNKIRYVEYIYFKEKRSYQISSVDDSEYISLILSDVKKGKTIDALANALVEYDNEIDKDEALGFIDSLITEQLLVSEMDPSVSGEELLDQILDVLEKINKQQSLQSLQKLIGDLKEIQTDLINLDHKLFNKKADYSVLEEKIKALEVPYDKGKLYQTDLFSKQNPTDQINGMVRRDLRKVAECLNKLSQPLPKNNLSDFQEKFFERYEEAEVPLLKVLDNEAGIGYAGNNNHTGDHNPLIQDLGVYSGMAGDREIKWNAQQSFLFKKLINAIKSGDKIIRIKTDELGDFTSNWENTPDSMSIMFRYYKDKIYLDNFGGTSAINLLGRFGTGNPEIKELIEDIAAKEQELNPDKVIAEIVHLPDARVGNILMRPSFRAYEIPYLSPSNLPLENQIDLTDLTISVRKNRLVLKSKKLGKEVLPRLGNAHNFGFNSVPVYHFLSDMQRNQMRSAIFFNWGDIANEFSYLPRVEMEGVVVSLETWNCTKKELEVLFSKDKTLDEKVAEWRKQLDLPQHIILAEGDNELPINLDDLLSVQMFVELVKKKPFIQLKENLLGTNGSVVKNSDQEEVSNQMVAILIRKDKESQAMPIETENSNITQSYAPGSEWIYYKLYCGLKTSDEILADVIYPLTLNWQKRGIIDKWFFIRYGDPHPHIRVRFHLSDILTIREAMIEFHSAIFDFLENGLIWKVLTDTYQPELKRYGGNTIKLAEKIFYHDSKNCAEVLSMLSNDAEGKRIRWLYAIKAVDELLNNFGFDLEEKNDVIIRLREAFGREFGMNKHLNKQLDKKYRVQKQDVIAILDGKWDQNHELSPLMELLDAKSSIVKPLVDEIKFKSMDDKSAVPMSNLLGSYTHMFINRFFKSRQRLYELVIYDFLSRTYRSQIAREKAFKKQ